MQTENPNGLPQEARYFPVEEGLHRVTAGLKNLGTPFGNGEADLRVLQLDSRFQKYRDNKIECRKERLSKYYCTSQFSAEASKAVCRKLISVLTQEYPTFFRWEQRKDSGILTCRLTSDSLHFRDFQLQNVESPSQPEYRDGLDALACQIPEDIAVVSHTSNPEKDWLAAIHLCAAGHWSAEQKIGKNFTDVHAPVPHISPITQASRAMVHAMIHKGPFVRFVWGFATDNRLNHHIEPPPGWDAAQWKGRNFSEALDVDCPFYLRVERQVTLGIPEVDSALFFIRVYFFDGREIRSRPEQRDRLVLQLQTMDEDFRRYKGLTDSMDALLAWLKA